MTTYWLLGENKPDEFAAPETEITEDTSKKILQQPQANTPSIVRELVPDNNMTSTLKIENENSDKQVEETTPLMATVAGNGSTHPL